MGVEEVKGVGISARYTRPQHSDFLDFLDFHNLSRGT
jgi:hypothetical protein